MGNTQSSNRKKTKNPKKEAVEQESLGVEEQELVLVDLHGYPSFKNTSTDYYNPVIPSNAVFSHSGSGSLSMSPYGKKLNVTRLPQTDILTVLDNEYNKQYKNVASFSSDIVPLQDVVCPIEKNVVALSHGKGEPLASGLLIDDRLVLTARHGIEGVNIGEITIRLNFQLMGWGMDFGVTQEVLGVLEENVELDYAILLLKNNVKKCQPVKFLFCEDFSGESVFLHHPKGGPKKVSVHATLDSPFYSLSHASFHDSEKGSSGGVYCNAEAKVFALHLLKNSSTTGASWIKNIYEASGILAILYSSDGNSKGLCCHHDSDSGILGFLPITKFSNEYYVSRRERVDRPQVLRELNPVNRAGKIDLTYHHIIPISDMEFLWMIGKESLELDNCLASISLSDRDVDNNFLTINSFAWATWNLFVGPSDRTDDPRDGNRKEANKPNSFNLDLWDFLDRLYDQIQRLWLMRHQLSNFSQSPQEFRKKTTKTLDQRDGMGTLKMESMEFVSIQSQSDQNLTNYQNQIGTIIEELTQLNLFLQGNQIIHPHPLTPGDWNPECDQDSPQGQEYVINLPGVSSTPTMSA